MANKKYIDLYKCREDFYNDILSILSDDITNDRANEIIDVFDSLPTADVQEVKRGYWIPERNPDENNRIQCFHCSVCDDDFHDIGAFVATKYCPNCGARMDGEEE